MPWGEETGRLVTEGEMEAALEDFRAGHEGDAASQRPGSKAAHVAAEVYAQLLAQKFPITPRRPCDRDDFPTMRTRRRQHAMNGKTTTRVGICLDSGEAFNAYYAATGKAPTPIPEGMNTKTTTFTDAEGRPAMLVQQRGFEQTPEEKARGDEVNGLMLAVALDAATPEIGFAALDEWQKAMLDPDPEHLRRIVAAVSVTKENN